MNMSSDIVGSEAWVLRSEGSVMLDLSGSVRVECMPPLQEVPVGALFRGLNLELRQQN